MKFKEFYLGEDDYRGMHKAPDKDDAPLHNLEELYPEDIYSSDAVKLYGTGDYSKDAESINIIQSARNRPRKPIKIYRAVPDINHEIKKKMKPWVDAVNYFYKWRFTPLADKNPLDKNKEYNDIYDKYFDFSDDGKAWIDAMDAKIQEFKDKMSPPIKINSGDWVTINKRYAIEHGRDNLNGKYKIVTKTVPARTLYTDGNSIHEWGYNK